MTFPTSWIDSRLPTDGVVEGRFPRRALGSVLGWTALHREELLEDWRRAGEGGNLLPVAPLE